MGRPCWGRAVELSDVVARYAAAMEHIDRTVEVRGTNQRTGERYLPGVRSLNEAQVVAEVDAWWGQEHPEDFAVAAEPRLGIRYPTLLGHITRCDHVFTTDAPTAEPEWAIEWKNATLVGNNGKNNDFTTTKVLSPYLKDRSLLHDVLRLSRYPLARRHGVVGYGFHYGAETCEEAERRHPQHRETIQNIRDACEKNGGSLTLRPLLNFADSILRVRGFVVKSMAEASFEAWRHPAGGRGIIFGWEVRLPEREEGFDPRHPW
jgi:hypothetical protein